MFFNILFTFVFLFRMFVSYFVYPVFSYCFVYYFSFPIYIYIYIYSCLPPISLEFYRPVPPGGHPIAVNKYIISYVVFFLLGDSPVSEFHVPTFRNPLFHLHRWCGQET